MAFPHLHFGVYLDGEYINPIYLYGTEGLMAFKTYASTYASANSQIREIEGNLKLSPSKVVEEDNKQENSGLIIYVEQDGFSRDLFIENQVKNQKNTNPDENKDAILEIPDGITLVD